MKMKSSYLSSIMLGLREERESNALMLTLITMEKSNPLHGNMPWVTLEKMLLKMLNSSKNFMEDSMDLLSPVRTRFLSENGLHLISFLVKMDTQMTKLRELT